MSAVEPLYERLGIAIRVLRGVRGMTQEQLGTHVVPAVGRATIANIEAGKQRILAHSLVDIAEALGVTVDWLLAGARDGNRRGRR